MKAAPGKWITVYAREGHTFAVIAGLRLDTTPFDHYTGEMGTSLVQGLPPTAASMQGIPSGCKSTVVSAVLSGNRPAEPKTMR